MKMVQPTEGNGAAAPWCGSDVQVPECERGEVTGQALYPQAGHGVVGVDAQGQAAQGLWGCSRVWCGEVLGVLLQ